MVKSLKPLCQLAHTPITMCSFSPQLRPFAPFAPFAPFLPCSGSKPLPILPPALEGLVPFHREPNEDLPNVAILGGIASLFPMGNCDLSAKNGD